MFRRATYIKLFLGLTFIPATLFASSAFGQSPSALTDTKQKDVATTPESRTNKSQVSTSEPSANTSAQIKPEKEDRYQDGIVIYQNSDDSKVPFLLKFNINSQIRWLNTVNSPTTFTDHLGNVREVHTRDDITVNRAMFILGGYMF